MWAMRASFCSSPTFIVPLTSVFSCRESAATLEAESGYIMEVSEVSQFRQNILEGNWDQAISLLHSMGIDSEEILLVCYYVYSEYCILIALLGCTISYWPTEIPRGARGRPYVRRSSSVEE